ncbi:hypothetical protein E4U55_007084 [Claviceps digitariae]|nr:hypothetical protein E4U55_007084 [Claviceps digitariae]
MDPRRSFAASHTKYHSFHDIELQEPPSPPRTRRGASAAGEAAAGASSSSSSSSSSSTSTSTSASSTSSASCRGATTGFVTAARMDASLDARRSLPSALKMQRHDSGYASRRTSDASLAAVPPPTSQKPQTPSPRAHRSRPSTRRSGKSYPQPAPPQSPYTRTNSGSSPGAGSGSGSGNGSGNGTTHASPTVYFQFPTPQLVDSAETSPPPPPSSPRHHLLLSSHDHPPRRPPPPSSPSRGCPSPIELFPPPATTHYWTSDSTRRLEYAAIDAASRGVKGWVRRHLIPDCFTTRHVGFDDDSGSVRRYRLELLEEEESPERQRQRQRLRQQQQQEQRKRGWSSFLPLRKSKRF